jgi:hypothetical protein
MFHKKGHREPQRYGGTQSLGLSFTPWPSVAFSKPTENRRGMEEHRDLMY